MNTATQDISSPARKGRKLALMLGGGAVAGFLGATGVLTLIDSGVLGSLDPSREIALLVSLLYGFMGLLVCFGAMSPRLGARMLNVQDADELREMKQSLLASGIASLAFGAVLAVLALTGTDRVLAPPVAAVVAGTVFVVGALASARSIKYADELMRAVSRQSAAAAYYLTVLFVGGWAALSILGVMPALQMIDVLTLLWVIMLIAAVGVCAKRGLLAMR